MPDDAPIQPTTPIVASTIQQHADLAKMMVDCENDAYPVKELEKPCSNLFCFVVLADKQNGTIYTNGTGDFPVRSFTRMPYMLVTYCYDSNAILVEPIKNLTDEEMVRAFKTHSDKKPSKLMLNNPMQSRNISKTKYLHIFTMQMLLSEQ